MARITATCGMNIGLGWDIPPINTRRKGKAKCLMDMPERY
jgi:hypothetical protein